MRFFHRKPPYVYTCQTHHFTTTSPRAARFHIKWDMRETAITVGLKAVGLLLNMALKNDGYCHCYVVPFPHTHSRSPGALF